MCAQYAADKKAEDLVALDLREISGFTDFFLICSGTSEPHLKAIASEIRSQLREQHGLKAAAVDGYPSSQWIILDYTDVVIHIFHESKRPYYGIEELWSDAPRLELPVL
ncbi:MAG: ribosome silencing factor [Chthoniobacteraceae bacterium]